MTRLGRIYGFDNACPKCGRLVGDHLWNGDCPKPKPYVLECGCECMPIADVPEGAIFTDSIEVTKPCAVHQRFRAATIEECAQRIHAEKLAEAINLDQTLAFDLAISAIRSLSKEKP